MILSVISQKGSQSKTTTAVNVAAALGGPGLVVDSDHQQQDATNRFGQAIPGVEFVKQLPKAVETFAVVDTPPQIGREHGPALLRSDLIIVPVVPNTLGLDALKRTIASLEDVAEQRPETRALIVVTQAPANQFTAGVIECLRSVCVWPVAETVIPRKEAQFEHALMARRPLVLYRPNSAGAQAYMNLAEEIQSHVRSAK